MLCCSWQAACCASDVNKADVNSRRTRWAISSDVDGGAGHSQVVQVLLEHGAMYMTDKVNRQGPQSGGSQT